MKSGTPTSRWEPLPLWAVASGQYTTGALCVVPALALLWLVHFVRPSTSPGVGHVFFSLVLAIFVMKTIDLLAFRATSIRQRKDDPGSAAMTTVAIVSPLVGGMVGTLLAPDRFWSIALVSTMLIVFLPVVLLLDQPWKEGDGREETRRKIAETKAMTRRTFREE